MSKCISIVFLMRPQHCLTAWRPKAPAAGSLTKPYGTSSKRWGSELFASTSKPAIANAERDLAIVAEWFPLEEEAWRTFEAASKLKKITKSRADLTFLQRGDIYLVEFDPARGHEI